MPTPALSSSDVKLLSQVLHFTSKNLGRTSQLAPHREMISKLLGYSDWNAACALLPQSTDEKVQVSIAQLEVPSHPTRFFMAFGLDAPWRLPEKVRDHLNKHSHYPAGIKVLKYSRPDPIAGRGRTHWKVEHFDIETGAIKVLKMPLDPNISDECPRDCVPVVLSLSGGHGGAVSTLTVWNIQLRNTEEERIAIYHIPGMYEPFFNSLVETITGQAPELRQAYCLINIRHGEYLYRIVRCDERGRELEITKLLHDMPQAALYAELAPFNKALGLSLIDVKEITSNCIYNNEE